IGSNRPSPTTGRPRAARTTCVSRSSCVRPRTNERQGDFPEEWTSSAQTPGARESPTDESSLAIVTNDLPSIQETGHGGQCRASLDECEDRAPSLWPGRALERPRHEN